ILKDGSEGTWFQDFRYSDTERLS
ncbi:hypothetical protein Tco_0647247, partial [Tanacetum coccineum]